MQKTLKKVISIAAAICMCLSMAAITGPTAVKAQPIGTTYYVDSNAPGGGNGSESPWNSIDQVNNHGAFQPSDQILFKRGCEWDGMARRELESG